jgi:hypothetical protein
MLTEHLGVNSTIVHRSESSMSADLEYDDNPLEPTIKKLMIYLDSALVTHTRADVSRLEPKPRWRSYGMTCEDHAVAP